jgi:hypothetical protein
MNRFVKSVGYRFSSTCSGRIYSRLTRRVKHVLKIWNDAHPPKGTDGCTEPDGSKPEAARFVRRRDQLPLTVSSRDCDAEDRIGYGSARPPAIALTRSRQRPSRLQPPQTDRFGFFTVDEQLPAAGVRAAIHVEYLSGYLSCPCQAENSVDNVLYTDNFPHWLQCLQMVLGIILVQRCVHDARGAAYLFASLWKRSLSALAVIFMRLSSEVVRQSSRW